jgi:hypothetical protein
MLKVEEEIVRRNSPRDLTLVFERYRFRTGRRGSATFCRGRNQEGDV